MELPDNYELELLGQPRKAYRKGEKVLVHSSEYLRLLRMGLVEVGSKEIKHSDIFAIESKKK
jgi:hypothetical protein